MALQSILSPNRRESLSTPSAGVRIIRKIALNLVAQDRGTQTSLRGRRKKAAWNDGYMLQIIAHQAHA